MDKLENNENNNNNQPAREHQQLTQNSAYSAYNNRYKPMNKTHFNNNYIKTERGKIMIFIDGSNLFYTSQMMGIEIDYIKLVEALVGKDKLIRVYFYAGIDSENTLSFNWQYFMKRTGFKMVTKELQTFANGNRKANCDVEMAVDMVTLLNAFDTAIVITGDGDLARACEYLSQQGKQVELIGNKFNTNERLIAVADRFVDLETLRNIITKNIRNQS